MLKTPVFDLWDRTLDLYELMLADALSDARDGDLPGSGASDALASVASAASALRSQLDDDEELGDDDGVTFTPDPAFFGGPTARLDS